MNQKIVQYFTAGVALVWVLYPKTRMIHVYSAVDKIAVLRGGDWLDGGNVLPGFSVKIADVFAVLDR